MPVHAVAVSDQRSQLAHKPRNTPAMHASFLGEYEPAVPHRPCSRLCRAERFGKNITWSQVPTPDLCSWHCLCKVQTDGIQHRGLMDCVSVFSKSAHGISSDGFGLWHCYDSRHCSEEGASWVSTFNLMSVQELIQECEGLGSLKHMTPHQNGSEPPKQNHPLDCCPVAMHAMWSLSHSLCVVAH